MIVLFMSMLTYTNKSCYVCSFYVVKNEQTDEQKETAGKV